MSAIVLDCPTRTEALAVKAWAEGRTIFMELTDGRIVGFPADRFRILRRASEKELKAAEIPPGASVTCEIPAESH